MQPPLTDLQSEPLLAAAMCTSYRATNYDDDSIWYRKYDHETQPGESRPRARSPIPSHMLVLLSD